MEGMDEFKIQYSIRGVKSFLPMYVKSNAKSFEDITEDLVYNKIIEKSPFRMNIKSKDDIKIYLK